MLARAGVADDVFEQIAERQQGWPVGYLDRRYWRISLSISPAGQTAGHIVQWHNTRFCVPMATPMTRYAAARAVKGWSLAEAAAQMGTDELSYARMERAPTPAQRIALVNLYGPVLKRLAKEAR